MKIVIESGENRLKIEEREKYRFLRSILDTSGIPIDFWKEDIPNIDVLLKLKSVLESHNMSLITDNDGGMKIYIEKDLIAEWFKPRFIMKKNENEIDPKKKIYMIMETKTFSMF